MHGHLIKCFSSFMYRSLTLSTFQWHLLFICKQKFIWEHLFLTCGSFSSLLDVCNRVVLHYYSIVSVFWSRNIQKRIQCGAYLNGYYVCRLRDAPIISALRRRRVASVNNDKWHWQKPVKWDVNAARCRLRPVCGNLIAGDLQEKKLFLFSFMSFMKNVCVLDIGFKIKKRHCILFNLCEDLFLINSLFVMMWCFDLES